MPRTRRTFRHAWLAGALLIALLAATALAQSTHVLLVLDASGSMYLKLEDGQYRIAAAKDALTQFVTRLPDDPDLNVGLRVYGANLIAVEEGACLDSELVVPVAGFARAELVRTIQAIDARGATPIAYSLELALEDLRGLEGRKVVVLVTDGAESCGGDVRAAVEALTAEGLDVDVRIIGFALSDFAIATFDGLGAFESTHSASELASALGRAVGVETDATHRVTVTLTRDGEPVAEGATVRLVDAVSGDATSLALGTDGVFAAGLPAGNYRAEVADAFSPAPLAIGGLPVTPEGENAFAFELVPAAEVALAVEPTDPRAGSVVSVRFEGAPVTDGNWLTVVPRDVDDTVAVARAYVDGASGTVELQIPGEAAELEARFHLALPEGGTRVIGRSPAFASTALTATLAAPAEVAAGTRFDVVWDGPADEGDYLAIVPVGTREGTFAPVSASTRDGSPATLIAPPEPGAYEVRYVFRREHRAIARVPVAVTPATARIDAPAEVATGDAFEVVWDGPGHVGDYLTIVPADARDGAFHLTSTAQARDGSPAKLTAPPEPGDYEVRYVLSQGHRALVTVPVEVVASAARLEVPPAVPAGEAIEVAWEGPANPGDYLTIVPAGARDGAFHLTGIAQASDGSPLTLYAPPSPGDYEVRYVLTQGNRMLVGVPITVTDATASLRAPAEVGAGEAFEVVWDGPAGPGDYLTIVPAGARDGAFHLTSTAQARDGSPARLTAPDEPGEYEVRYVLNQGRLMLIGVPIVVR